MEEFYKHVGEVFRVAHNAGVYCEVRHVGDRMEIVLCDGNLFTSKYITYEAIEKSATPRDIIMFAAISALRTLHKEAQNK